MLMGWIILVLLIGCAVCVVLLLRLRKEKQTQQLIMQRMRQSGTYRSVLSMVRRENPDLLEQVLLSPEQVELVLLGGSHRLWRFSEHQTDPLQPGPLLAMTQALAMDCPTLQDEAYYTFTAVSEKQGGPRYCYTMRHDRKDYLLRMLRDHPAGE